MKKLDKEVINRFYYCQSSPTGLRWAVPVYRGYNGSLSILREVGDVAGSVREDGYASVTVTSHGQLFAHRIIWELVFGEIPNGFFVDHKDGDRLNNHPNNLRVVKRLSNARNISMMSSNKSGITGVSKDEKSEGRVYWKAKWVDLEGISHTKSFSVLQYGSDEAFRLACDYRAKMIEELNNQGAGYTERHGK